MARLLLLVAAGLLAVGCGSGSDKGEAPPPRKEMTQAEIDAMPPQARAAMEAAQKSGQATQQSQGKVGG